MNIRNKALYNKIEKFISASIPLLNKFVTKEKLPQLPETLSKGVGLSLPLFLLIDKHLIDLEKLSEFAECAEYIIKNTVTRKAMEWKNEEEKRIIDKPLKLHNFRPLYILLGKSLKKNNNGFSFEIDNYKKAYIDFEKSTYSKVTLNKLIAPLEGLYGNVEEVNFLNNFRLRKLSDQEKDNLRRDFAGLYKSPLPDVPNRMTDYLLEVVYSQKKGVLFATNGFTDIVTLLRLFKRGQVGFSIVKNEPVTWRLQSLTTFGFNYTRQGRISSPSYQLNTSEVPSLLRLWRRFKHFNKNLSSSPKGKYLNLALKWFNYGVEEKDYENKIIGFFIAFEALCLPHHGELSYRLSNRVAIILGKNGEKADYVRKFMVKAYGVRSEIVHGNEISPITLEGVTIPIDEFSLMVEEYLREVLRAFLIFSNKYDKQKVILEILDKGLHDVKTKRRIQKIISTR